jgi:2-hydroxycyclohexanecarboxyl-CoA dehydrogenase
VTKNAIALITGAAGGMGRAVVERIVRDGYTVAAMDINEPELKRATQKAGAQAHAFPCDQTDEAATRDAVKRIEQQLGPVSVLINTIGWVGTTRFVQEDASYWRKIVAINFESVLYVTHAVLPGMIERKAGKIVNISSDAGRIGTSGEAVYAAMKAGVIAFSKSIARELARYNININVIAPGPTETPLLKAEMEEDPELVKRMVRLIPFRRVGQPEDMAAAISFFCSPDSNYITGQTLSVSGGLTML